MQAAENKMNQPQHSLDRASSVSRDGEFAGTENKERNLREFFQSLGSTLVAFSGGTDSAYVAFAARRTLGDRMLAVIADSPSLPRRQLREANEFARTHAIPLTVVSSAELSREEYAANPPNRCYFCKHELHTRLHEIRLRLGYETICDGTNLDDAGDYRPGRQAAIEMGVRSPLLECGITKAEVRALSRAANLPTWDVPASACLSSRIPYGQAVTREKLQAIEDAEEILRDLGFRVSRVRHFGARARIEIGADELARAFIPKTIETIRLRFLSLGFSDVEIDPRGYRMGSLNEALTPLKTRA